MPGHSLEARHVRCLAWRSKLQVRASPGSGEAKRQDPASLEDHQRLVDVGLLKAVFLV